MINYSIRSPGGNLKTSLHGQAFSENRPLLRIGRASLSLAELTATFAGQLHRVHLQGVGAANGNSVG